MPVAGLVASGNLLGDGYCGRCLGDHVRTLHPPPPALPSAAVPTQTILLNLPFVHRLDEESSMFFRLPQNKKQNIKVNKKRRNQLMVLFSLDRYRNRRNARVLFNATAGPWRADVGTAGELKWKAGCNVLGACVLYSEMLGGERAVRPSINSRAPGFLRWVSLGKCSASEGVGKKPLARNWWH